MPAQGVDVLKQAHAETLARTVVLRDERSAHPRAAATMWSRPTAAIVRGVRIAKSASAVYCAILLISELQRTDRC
jgi:hypothetical protein